MWSSFESSSSERLFITEEQRVRLILSGSEMMGTQVLMTSCDKVFQEKSVTSIGVQNA